MSYIYFKTKKVFHDVSKGISRVRIKYIFFITIPLVLYLLYYVTTAFTNIPNDPEPQSSNTHIIFQKSFNNAPLVKTWNLIYGDQEKELDEGKCVDLENMMLKRYSENDYMGMLNTPGCYIPRTIMKYKRSRENTKNVCGRRIVFLEKSRYNENKVRATIYKKALQKLANGLPYHCCYYFASEITKIHNNTKSQTLCSILYHGKEFTLKSYSVSVKCHTESAGNVSIIYEDLYLFTVKIPRVSEKEFCEQRYNVLMIGIHAMSLKKTISSIPKTVQYMRDNSYFTFRGYNKVEDFTGMILAVLTGQNYSSIKEKCSMKMDDCNDLMLWSLYKKAGYITAYGEEGLMLRRNFHGDYTFRHQPTDHFTEPFFSNHERYSSNTSQVCTGQMTSSQQLLEFAHDFAVTYREQSFFGLFWINSDGFDEDSTSSSLLDYALQNLLTRLALGRVTDNTIVVLFSDQGARPGPHRTRLHGFFDERLPSLFLKHPQSLTLSAIKKYANIYQNQYRLTSAYDLHKMLVNVLENCKDTPLADNGDVLGTSLYDSIRKERTCIDASIGYKWCSCYDMKIAAPDEKDAIRAFEVVSMHLRSMIIPTKRNWTCADIEIKGRQLAFTSYKNETTAASTYVLVIRSSTGNKTFEATVVTGDTFEVAGPVTQISPYHDEGHCVLNYDQRFYCYCIGL